MRTPSALFENGCNIAPFPLRGRCQPFGLTDEVARVNFLLSHPSPNTKPQGGMPHMMKRILLLCTALLLALTPAMAQENSLILSATVEAVQTVALNAPASGELAPFIVRAGDAVSAGETLFTVEPVKMYAPIDGVVSGVFAEAGDIASGVTGRYGAILYIDYEERWQLQGSTRTGADKAEAVRTLVKGPISPELPASALRLHADAVIILDAAAASLL